MRSLSYEHVAKRRKTRILLLINNKEQNINRVYYFYKKQYKSNSEFIRYLREYKKRRSILLYVSFDIISSDINNNINNLTALITERERDIYLFEDNITINSIL